MTEEIELTMGSKYVIRSLSSEKEVMVTSGIFIGYTFIGKDEDGICIKMDESHGNMKGRVRILPVPMILAIDVIEEKKKEKKKEATHYYS